MVNIKYIVLIGIVFTFFSSCVDEEKLFELDDFEKGALPNFANDPQGDGFIGLGLADEFTMVFSVDFFNSLEQSADGTTQGSGRADNNLEFEDVDLLDIEVLWTDVSTGQTLKGILGSTDTWPTTLSYSGLEIINAIDGLSAADQLELGDVITIAGGVHLADGRSLPAFVPNASGNFVLGYSPSFFGHPGFQPQLQYSVACNSTLDVEVDYVVLSSIDANGSSVASSSGTFTWIANANGNYTWQNYTFGNYQSAFGCCELNASSVLRVTDLCDDLEISAADGFGCSWALAIDEVSGPKLVITLSGGCVGTVTVQMTRTDGTDWPNLF